MAKIDLGRFNRRMSCYCCGGDCVVDPTDPCVGDGSEFGFYMWGDAEVFLCPGCASLADDVVRVVGSANLRIFRDACRAYPERDGVDYSGSDGGDPVIVALYRHMFLVRGPRGAVTPDQSETRHLRLVRDDEKPEGDAS